MGQSAFIKLVDGAKQDQITLEDVKQLLQNYIKMTCYTGQQLGWDYHRAAFPYDIKEQEQEGLTYLMLKGNDSTYYNYLIIGTGQEQQGISFIQVVLPSSATHGDKAKANEYCKFLGKKLKGELHLFNGRIIFYNKHKG
jgi:hypothetical protein